MWNEYTRKEVTFCVELSISTSWTLVQRWTILFDKNLYLHNMVPADVRKAITSHLINWYLYNKEALNSTAPMTSASKVKCSFRMVSLKTVHRYFRHLYFDKNLLEPPGLFVNGDRDCNRSWPIIRVLIRWFYSRLFGYARIWANQILSIYYLLGLCKLPSMIYSELC